jgi:hypothetical protein
MMTQQHYTDAEVDILLARADMAVAAWQQAGKGE